MLHAAAAVDWLRFFVSVLASVVLFRVELTGQTIEENDETIALSY